MTEVLLSERPWKRFLFLLLVILVFFLTLLASWRYATPLEGLPDTETRTMESGWFCENGSSQILLDSIPCQVNMDGNTLYLTHDLTEEDYDLNHILVVQTRYQSIRIWADQRLIYEAAQGKEHALSSMWHFIPAEKYSGASVIRIELTKYDTKSTWEISAVFQAYPEAIAIYLLRTHAATLLVWLCCMFFTLLLLSAAGFMAIKKIAGISLVLALASFIFLSGTWILLDSKITTVVGGNYALTYFFSYFAFYMLPIPLMIYFQLIWATKSRFLQCLIWISVGNTGVWMMLHLLGIISIRNTAWSVHLIIILFVAVLIKEFFQDKEKRNSKRLVCTFWGIGVIIVSGFVSIILFYTNFLLPTNSDVLYAGCLLILIFCMTMDVVLIFGQMWKEKQYLEFYQQLALEDSMTGLYNRNAYELRIREITLNPPGEVGFISFDIDRMKEINDTYGHNAGDQAISLVARCIQEVFGESGVCYRIGGDEFCVILTMDGGIKEKLQKFDKLVKIRNENSFSIHVSYGWANRTFKEGKPITVEEILELKRNSDKKLYHAKSVGGSNT